jgi:hypothetical protein
LAGTPTETTRLALGGGEAATVAIVADANVGKA